MSMLVARRHLARAWKCAGIHRNTSTIPPLPPIEVWKEAFKKNPKEIARRPFLCDPLLADRAIEAFLPIPKDSASLGNGKVVIEAYPGAGALTRSLLALPPTRLKKLIVLEDNPVFFDHLKELEEHDPRVTVIPQSGFLWSAYTELEARGLLDDVRLTPWESKDAPDIHFISHLPNTVHGDQLLAQIFRCIPDQSWLFKYGRIPLSLLMTESIWERTSANVRKSARCKLSVIAEAVSDCSEAIPSSKMRYNEHFYPPSGVDADDESTTKKKKKTSGRQIGVPYVAVNVKPKAKPFVQPGLLDKWDYVTRKLFVLKASSLKKGMPSLAPGALTLLTMLENDIIPGGKKLDPNTEIRHLSVEEWALIVQAFDEWPFAPEDLMVTDSFFRDIEKKD